MEDGDVPRRDWSNARPWLIGAGAFLAWLALLWFMFGDVL